MTTFFSERPMLLPALVTVAVTFGMVVVPIAHMAILIVNGK